MRFTFSLFPASARFFPKCAVKGRLQEDSAEQTAVYKKEINNIRVKKKKKKEDHYLRYEQCFAGLLFIKLYMVVLTFGSF